MASSHDGFRTLAEFGRWVDSVHGKGSFRRFTSSNDYYGTRIQWLYDNKVNLDADIISTLKAMNRRRKSQK